MGEVEMMVDKFLARLLCIKSNWSFLTVGKVYNQSELKSQSHDLYRVIDDDGDNIHFEKNCFRELLEPLSFEIDKVI